VPENIVKVRSFNENNETFHLHHYKGSYQFIAKQ